jgi:hypothetical protein
MNGAGRGAQRGRRRRSSIDSVDATLRGTVVDQVEGVTDAERDAAWRRIRAAARRYGVDISVRGWRSFFTSGRNGRR